ncbi:MAG: aminomethyl-transferring glycine dehydrogenase subunit GcvPA, partial [Desulfatitalea sp.]
MRYMPHTATDIQAMLAAVGARHLDDLFAAIPADCRRARPLDLPPALSEWDLDRHMETLAGATATAPAYTLFLGAGSYDHHIPETIKQLLRRGEFFTAYTPYQPEVSQGTLQAVYEYQTLVGRLLGMEVANASMYDGASALAEALLMTLRITKRRRVALSRAIHPHYRQVVETYLRPTGFEIVDLPYGADGRTDLAPLAAEKDLAAVAVQSPNFFGCMEDLKAVAAATHAHADTLMIAAFSEPLAFGLYEAPGRLGADIVCGEGQSLGIPRSFGGPGVGLFACRMQHLRSMPGRLVGKTVDLEGRRGFVLTLSTREQHIRRERATSNICTNQGLCALAAAMYMGSLGGSGFRQLARLNYDTAGYLRGALLKAGVRVPFGAPTFNEFVVRLAPGSKDLYQRLLERRIVAGLPLEKYYPELADHYLL